MQTRFGILQTAVVLSVAAIGICHASFGFAQSESASVSESPISESLTDAEVIAEINRLIEQSWTDNEVEPSAMADDFEWARRAYLDTVGHIPPGDEIEQFVASEGRAKRAQLIEKLLDDPAYVRFWTTNWTNLAIGLGNPDGVSRLGMRRFFREVFGKNRPWDEAVYELISGSGHYELNGEVNFLLAQDIREDEGVRATANATRLFLGIQVQCTQCHNHPFNDWKQDQFWQFNSFFRQTRSEEFERYDETSGQMVTDYVELKDATDDPRAAGPVFFEKRSGLMQVAFPTYFGVEVDPSEGTNRRSELARLMISEQADPLVAKAFVNRTWGHFFGYGFTRPVDDMGPHNPPSHPVLLDYLTEQFVEADYDVKRLIRWITNSRAYHLTSQFNENNTYDNPAAGETPLFSHMYVKRMGAEQLYDSLIIATEAHKSGRTSWDAAEQQRQRWLQQFVVAFGNDEGTEATTFDGTIPQALMLMNGELIREAVSAEPGSFLHTVMTDSKNHPEAIGRIYLASLGRPASGSERNTAMKLIRGSETPLAGYQDLFWALLNSNEFIFIR
ncbi:DUF1549 and DUF1553 domain-containing protein [Stratiformator vulcanicus]|nr:DUF1549 and DUF1553 domain-containing protein [Stratiformator vulcanicus]